MKTIAKRIALGLLVGFVLFIGLFVVPYFANIVMPWDRSNAIATAIAWGGFASLPASAEVIAVETKGSMFTRQFIIKFNCEKKDIDGWVFRSKLNRLTPTRHEDLEVYDVPGQQGSIGGRVYIDHENNELLSI